jgi:hypothetical protein
MEEEEEALGKGGAAASVLGPHRCREGERRVGNQRRSRVDPDEENERRSRRSHAEEELIRTKRTRGEATRKQQNLHLPEFGGNNLNH